MKLTTRTTRDVTRAAFTLVELLVVITVISLLMVMVLPSIAGLFRSGSQSQARNMADANLRSTRSMAVQRRRYTALHFQRGLDGGYWMAPLEEQDGSGQKVFDMADGAEATKLPGTMGGGEVSAKFVAGDNYIAMSDTAVSDFTTFTVIFDPNGRLVTEVDGNDLKFDSGSLLLEANPAAWTQRRKSIWERSVALKSEDGVRAFGLFDKAEFDLITEDDVRRVFLSNSARFLPINPYVGGLVRTKHE